jgi:hypothetical protein
MAGLDVMIAVHEELLKLSCEIERAKIRFRKPSAPTRKLPSVLSARVVVDRDRAMNALLVKAIHTAKAIRLLCDGGFSGDAYALGRVLLENAVVMAWVIRGPATERLDTFCLADTPRKNRWIDILEQYYSDHPDLAAKVEMFKDADADAIARELYKDAHTTWAMFENENGKLTAATVKDMFLGASDDPQGSSFAYDAPYFDASSYVHSGPESSRRLAAQLKRFDTFSVKVSPEDPELSTRAMSLANVSLALALAAFSEYTGIKVIATGLDGIVETIKAASHGSTS